MVAALTDALPDCLHLNAWRHQDVVEPHQGRPCYPAAVVVLADEHGVAQQHLGRAGRGASKAVAFRSPSSS
jgi:hypothetical protein